MTLNTSIQPLRPLTTVQREIVARIRAGKTYEQMADELEMSERTVQNYVRDISWLLPETTDNPNSLPPLRRVERWAMAKGGTA